MNPDKADRRIRKRSCLRGSRWRGKDDDGRGLAVQAAVEGKKTAVLTIDPAKRLGFVSRSERVDERTNESGRKKVLGGGLKAKAPLYAMMLDTKTTFDQVVTQYAPTRGTSGSNSQQSLLPEHLGNLSGTQEYMAMEKLYELHTDGNYDLIVIDTPPTRNALDFLDAPKSMTDFFESRVLRWFLMPYMKAGGGFIRVANVAADDIPKIVKRIVGRRSSRGHGGVLHQPRGHVRGFQAASTGCSHTAPIQGHVICSRDFTGRRVRKRSDILLSQTSRSRSSFRGPCSEPGPSQPRTFGFDPRPRQLSRLETGDADAQLLAKLLENGEAFSRVVQLEENNLKELAKRVPRHLWVRVPYLEREAVDFAGWA